MKFVDTKCAAGSLAVTVLLLGSAYAETSSAQSTVGSASANQEPSRTKPAPSRSKAGSASKITPPPGSGSSGRLGGGGRDIKVTPPPPNQRSYSVSRDGLWRADAPASEVGKFESLAALNTFGATEVPAGYQLTDFEIDIRGTDEELLGVWSQVAAVTPHQLHIDLTSAALTAKRQELAGAHQLFDIETYVVDGQRRYAGVWRPSNEDERVEVGKTWAQLTALKASHGAEGYYLVDVEPYFTLSGWRYVGLWHPGADNVHLEKGDVENAFVQSAQGLAQESGWRAIDIERRISSGDTLLVGLWEQGTDPDWLTVRGTWPLIIKNDAYLPGGSLPPESNDIEGFALPQPPIEARHLIDIETVSYEVEVAGPIVQSAIHDEPTTGPPDT